MSLEEFKSKILKRNQSRTHKITKSIGVYDIYKYIRKNKWFNIGQRLTEHQFYYIIREINKALTNELIEGNDIKFPYNMGILELRKYNPTLKFKNNKLINNMPIDWNKTLNLWYEDYNSCKNKSLVRINEEEIFKVYYNKSKAKYTNQVFYEFNINRKIKKELKNKIHNKEIDAYEMGRVAF